MLVNFEGHGDVIVAPTAKGHVMYTMAGIQLSEEQAEQLAAANTSKIALISNLMLCDIIQTPKGLAMVVDGEYINGKYLLSIVRLNRKHRISTIEATSRSTYFYRPTFNSEDFKSSLLLSRIKAALQFLPFGLPTKKLNLIGNHEGDMIRENIISLGKNRLTLVNALYVFIEALITDADYCRKTDEGVYFKTHGNCFYTDGYDIYADVKRFGEDPWWKDYDARPEAKDISAAEPLLPLVIAMLGDKSQMSPGQSAMFKAFVRNEED